MNQNIEQLLKIAKQNFLQIEANDHDEVIDVWSGLVNLLHADEWLIKELEFFNCWLKKLDIAKNHYQQYRTDWKLSDNRNKVTDEYYAISLILVLKYLEVLKTEGKASAICFKTCNVAYKILDLIGVNSFVDKTMVKKYLSELLNKISAEPISQPKTFEPNSIESSVLPITVLFWEGPIARAYLAAIKEMGLKVKKIIKLVSSLDLVNKKPVGKILPPPMRQNYAANKQFKQIFYWPNLYQNKYVDTVKAIQSITIEKLGFELNTLQSATKNLDLRQYTDELEILSITGLKDSNLERTLKAEDAKLFLFTGGGIVPNSLLALENKKMIHVHPGFLPEIRGADCVLWSQLVARRLSASAFFLAPGIDVGDVIHPAWLPDIELKFPDILDSRVKYRMIYGFLDPWVRSFVLKQAIHKTNGLKNITVSAQDENEGMTFHFMHQKMINHVIQKW